jgi:hypothetical protein
MEITSTQTLGEMITWWKSQKSIVEAHEAEAKAARSLLNDIEAGILIKMRDAGLESIAQDGVSLTIRKKFRAKYDPEMWESLINWASQNGMTYLIQRRLNDSKVLELVDNGVPLPEGLSIEGYDDLAFRRS